MEKTKLSTQLQGLGLQVEKSPGKGLSGKFLVPPFSILRTADADWLNRRRQWIRLGIKSEVGRKDTLLFKDKNLKDFQVYRKNAYVKVGDKEKEEKKMFLDTKKGEKWEAGKGLPIWQNTGTSIFDPVLCELMYAWFCPTGGQVVDPFAGGSVRGIVANYMGYNYWGSELREEQVEANIEQGKKILPNHQPTWVCGDAFAMLPDAPECDFVFSCPPYGDLEVYSDMEEDLSNKEYDEFLILYSRIIKRACRRLKQNRFACFIVTNFRDKKTGYYHNFVGDTVDAFENAGALLYNDGILVNSIGSLPLRSGKQFFAGRKFGKMHQNILVFYKGDPKEIKNIFNI